jgi:HEPN domain-containing protein
MLGCMPGPDPDHWLHRFTAQEWLRAAEGELARAVVAFRRKQQRAGVATARRAAGMACNAVLAIAVDENYGRSYMDHLRALAADAAVPEVVRVAAQALLETPLATDLVTLGPGDTRLADAAHLIVAHARKRISSAGGLPS